MTTTTGGARPGVLILADGTPFAGEFIGGSGPVSGEVVFQTGMTGYQEVLTDPSYSGQIVIFTHPHLGSYGVNPVDDQDHRPHPRGIVTRDLVRRASSWRAAADLPDWLRSRGLAILAGVDTRALTRHLRTEGSMPGAFGPADGDDGEAAVRAAAQAATGVRGADLVTAVTTPRRYRVGSGRWRITAYDFGIKRALLRGLARIGTVDVVPAGTPARAVINDRPDAVFLSNGPGDPAALEPVISSVRELVGRTPILGVCLGHQLLATALGGTTYQLPFGHHGINHPVRRHGHDHVEITSHNHNFAVAAETLPAGVEVTHVNLNDGVVEGLRCRDARAFSVQYHPEAGPGPHDASHLFGLFDEVLKGGAGHAA